MAEGHGAGSLAYTCVANGIGPQAAGLSANTLPFILPLGESVCVAWAHMDVGRLKKG